MSPQHPHCSGKTQITVKRAKSSTQACRGGPALTGKNRAGGGEAIPCALTEVFPKQLSVARMLAGKATGTDLGADLGAAADEQTSARELQPHAEAGGALKGVVAFGFYKVPLAEQMKARSWGSS